MAVNEQIMRATPDDVWDVLSDGWLYPLWVVGASRMREVDQDWPAVGAKLHHSVGTWPLLLDDNTEVVEMSPGASLVLHARARPSGTAEVRIHLEPVGATTRVVLEEDAVAGPGKLVPKVLRDVPLTWRNVESLRRLTYVVERRSAKSR